MPHDCCSHKHNHSDDSPEVGIQYSLYQKIYLDKVTCLNEKVENSGRTVFKSWDRRLDRNSFVESDMDQELLFSIPFSGYIKLKGVIVIGNEDESHPKLIRLFKDRPCISFEDVGQKCDQEWTLTRDPQGLVEYPVRAAKFTNMTHLAMHFPSNFGGPSTRINYIGLKGEFQQGGRQAVTLALYEARPLPQDHKGELPDPIRQEMF